MKTATRNDKIRLLCQSELVLNARNGNFIGLEGVN